MSEHDASTCRDCLAALTSELDFVDELDWDWAEQESRSLWEIGDD